MSKSIKFIPAREFEQIFNSQRTNKKSHMHITKFEKRQKELRLKKQEKINNNKSKRNNI